MKMIPVYKDMNSYPYKRNQMPSNQYYHPSWEAVPPQMKEDLSSSSCTRESWPYNYGYPVPMQCNNCCTHGQHPGYYNFRPPCSHFPAPPPPPPPGYHYFYGGYPPCPMYYTPPPHYSMELPRYEYEDSEPRDPYHCCGCLNHPGNVKGSNNVKIEEQEPDPEVKKSESSFPARANNFSHPVMWIPPEYIMNKQQPKRLVDNEENQQHDLPYVKEPQVQQRPTGTDAQENKHIPYGRKPHQSVLSPDQDPNSRYECFPLDLNKIKKLMEGGNAEQNCEQEIRSKDEKKALDVENKDQKKQSSYPVFWIPYDGREEDSLTGDVENTAGGTANEGSPAHNVLQVTDNETEKQSAAKVDAGRVRKLGADKKRIVKTIPVKQLEESASKLSKKEEEHKQEDTAKNNTSMQSSSSTKKSKLPPICLRLDPPKKKNGNGSLKSPTPGDKIRQDSDESKLESKTEQQQKEIKVKDAEKKPPSQNKIEVSRCAGEDNDVLIDKDKSADVQRGDCRVEAQEIQEAKEIEVQPENKLKRKVMSEMEAAAIIQAACRGHDVRRSEPIKKLKHIAKVHEEAIQVRKHLEDLESRAPINDKEKATFGETIMKLLLELDSMQGLHQSVRDVRRSVAKELISLQEKLDSIMSQQSAVLAQDISIARAVDELPKDNDLVEESGVTVESAGQPIKDLCMDGDKKVNTDEGQIFSSSDTSSSQPLPCQDGVSGFENRGTSEDSLVNMAANSDGDIAAPSLGLKMKEEPDVSETVQEIPPVEFQQQIVDTSPTQNHLEFSNTNEEASMLSELPQEVVDMPVDNGLLTGNNEQKQNLLVEVHQDVDGESLTNVSIIEDGAVENDMVTGKEDHKADIMSELPKDVVEKDKKDDDVELTDYDPRYSNEKDNVKQPHENAGSVSKMEKEEQEVDLLHNLSPEVNNDDSNELTEVDTSQNLNKDLVVEHTEIKSEICEQELPVGTLIPEHEMQQSKEVDGALGQYLEGQTSTVAGEMEMDEQNDKKVIEENEKLRAMLEKLLAAEKQQQEVISSLNGKVKDLEKRLDRRKNRKLTKIPRVRVSRPSCGKLANDSLRGKPTGIAS